MPSKHQVIAVRLEPDLYAAVEAAARQQNRTLSNFVATHLRAVVPVVVVKPGGFDSLAAGIAKVVSAGPVRRAKKHR